MTGFKNTTRPAERPTEAPYDLAGMRDGVVRSHPAFGMIVANRTSGLATLFGSPIQHNGFITIRIQTAQEVDHLHFARPMARELVAEVSLSEAQWARFVSTPNVGEGVPCSIRYMRDGALIAPPEIIMESDHEKRSADIKAEVQKRNAQYQAAVDALDALAKAPKISKADLQRVRAMFLHPVDYAGTNAQFMADSITEHMEHVETAVKGEIDAYLTRIAFKYPELTSELPTTDGMIEHKKEGGE